MNTERNHPRDQNSPQVQTMMDELRANAAGIDCAATYPLSPDDTFDIPANLIPGVDNKLPKSGLVVIYTHADVDPVAQEAHILAIADACGEHLGEMGSSTMWLPHNTAREALRAQRNQATLDHKVAIELRTLSKGDTECKRSDVTSQEADLTLFFFPGMDNTIILQRGKLRRSVAAWTNLTLTLPHI